MTAVFIEPEVQETIGDGDLDPLGHLVCECSEDISLCGLDLSDRPPSNPDIHHAECVVCEDLGPMPCPRCGE